MRRTLITILVAALVTATTLTACAPTAPPTPYEEMEDNPRADALAASLIHAYNKHPIRWNNDVKGHVIQTHGIVKDITGEGSIIFEPHHHTRKGKQLVCQFTDPQELTTVNRKDTITVSGKVDTISPYRHIHQQANLSECHLMHHQKAE